MRTARNPPWCLVGADLRVAPTTLVFLGASWFSPPLGGEERALVRLFIHGHRADDEQHIAAAAAADG